MCSDRHKPTHYAYEIDMKEAHTTSVKIVNLVGKGKRVLELGCAAGSMSRAFVEHGNCRVVGVEIDAEAAQLARDHCEEVIVADLNSARLDNAFRNERFDAIVAADILEHLVEPEHCLRMVHSLLATDGELIVSVPNIGYSGVIGALLTGSFPYAEKGILDKTHLRFFTRHQLESLLLATGFVPDLWETSEGEARHSEFATLWQRVPDDLKPRLQHGEHGMVYQWIVRARPVTEHRIETYLDAKRLIEHNLRREIERLNSLNVEFEHARQHAENTARHLEQINQHQEQVSAQRLAQLKKEQEAQHVALQHELVRLNNALQLQRQDSDALRYTLHQVYRSASWRVSAPIRWVGLNLRRLARLGGVARHLLEYPNQAPESLSRMWRDWRRDGISGLKKALKAVHNDQNRSYLWGRLLKDLAKERINLREQTKRLPRQPKISIIVPVFNTPAEILDRTVESVKTQIYENWELILSDDASPAEHVRGMLEKLARKDERIRIVTAETNGGVSAATNRAISVVSGEFVALLDHDDILLSHALLRLAQTVVADDPDMIYSDEVILDDKGATAVDFVCRPAFSKEFLRSHPYIVHLVAFRATLLKTIGGLDESLKIAQDYDLILRVAEQATRITHVPEFLYGWRLHQASTGHQMRDQATSTAIAVLERHLARCGDKASVVADLEFNYYDVRYALGKDTKIAIIIPTKNCGHLVRQCVDSIRKTVEGIDYRIVLIDHDSDDPESLEYFESLRHDCIVLGYSGPFNFSAINNWAVERIGNEFTHYLFCNNDIEATQPDWLARMLELAQQSDIGVVGAQLLYPGEQHIQHGGVTVGMHGAAEHNSKFMAYRQPNGQLFTGYRGSNIASHEMSSVTAACMLMRRDAFEKVGGYDERLAVGFGDVDLCLRVRQAGYRIIYCPKAVLVHHESFTRGKSTTDPHPEDSAFFRQRWAKILEEGDPFFNPNLDPNNTWWEYCSPLPIDTRGKRRLSTLNRLREVGLVTRGTLA